MDIVISDKNRKPIAQLADYTLDMAYGYGDDLTDGENSFTLSYPLADSRAYRLEPGCMWWVDGTEYGGVVDGMDIDTSDGVSSITYTGRSWTGILKGKILAPDSGQDYYTVSGQSGMVMGQLIGRAGLGSLFQADTSTVQVSGHYRYDDLYTAIRGLLAGADMKLRMRYSGNHIILSCDPVEHWSDIVDSDLMDFSFSEDTRPVNHLIGLGEGELKNRARSDWYADADGNVSQTQSLRGLDEVAQVYDYTNAKAAELSDSTQKKLKELQQSTEIKVDLHEGHSFDVNDTVTATDSNLGLQVTATIRKKIITVSGGVAKISYEAGGAKRSTINNTATLSVR